VPQVQPGSAVTIITRTGERLPRRALTSVEAGSDFMVVWVCREEEWEAAQREQRQPLGVPWPADDVLPAAAVTSAV
jgi:hypothetical protein